MQRLANPNCTENTTNDEEPLSRAEHLSSIVAQSEGMFEHQEVSSNPLAKLTDAERVHLLCDSGLAVFVC